MAEPTQQTTPAPAAGEKQPSFQQAWQRSGYFDSLNKRISSIEEYWSKMLHLNWVPAICTTMHRLARNIHGSSAMFGYASIADTAKELEKRLGEIEALQGSPTVVQRERISAAIRELKKAIRQEMESALASTQTHPPEELEQAGGGEGRSQVPLYLYVQDQSQAEYLRAQLAVHGYQVRAFGSVTQLGQACSQQPPAVIVAEVRFTEGQPELDRFAKIRNAKGRTIPLIYVSERGDYKARLKAFQTGCEGYLAEPLDLAELVGRIDEVTASLRREPQRVLIIDENLEAVGRYVRTLEPVGIVTQSLSKPTKIIKEIAEFRPDCVLAASTITEIDLLTLVGLVRAEEAFSTLPILVLSADRSEERRMAILDAGAEEVLDPAIKPGALISYVWLYVRRSRALGRRLRYLGQRDAVTGLYNRGYLLDHIGQQLLTPAAEGEIAVVVVQLDGFVELKDRLGAERADDALASLARVIQCHLAVRDIPARIADHRFGLLVYRNEWNGIALMAEQLRKAASLHSAEIAGAGANLTLSIGIGPCRGNDPELLLAEVGQACISAAAEGGDRLRLHKGISDRNMEVSESRGYLDLLLDNAKAGRMNLIYQPLVSIHGDGQERYETLIRVADEKGEPLPTRKLLEAAAEAGLLDKIDRVVLRQALGAARQRMELGKLSTLFVKFSPPSIRRAEELTVSGLEYYGLPGEMLTLLFPTKAVHHLLDKIKDLPRRLHALGCTIGLEYFGETVADVQLLDRFPVDYIKIHPILIRGTLGELQGDRLKFLIEEAHKRRIKVIMGFIEDAKSLTRAWQLDVDLLQGKFVQAPDEGMNFDFKFSGFTQMR